MASENSSAAAATSPALTREDPKNATEMLKAAQAALDDQSDRVLHNAMQTELETIRMSEGKDKKNDLHYDTEQEAVESLKYMVTLSTEKAGDKGKKWKFRTVPWREFDKTLDDVLLAFVRWAKVSSTSDSKSKKTNQTMRFNVSKAFRRFESYAEWMEETGDDLVTPGPLTAESVRETHDKWKTVISHDAHDRLVWWWPMARMDLGECRNIPPQDSLRLFVWLSHLIMFDEKAQKNGILFEMDFAATGFLEFLHLFPIKLGLALDRLTIGILPIRMQAMHMIGAPKWAKVLMSIMKPFISKKMRSRIILCKEKDHGRIVEDLGGKEYVLTGFGSCGGTLDRDIVAEKYCG